MPNFNLAQKPEKTSYPLIPQGTIVKVKMTIKKGDYDNQDKGWTGGYATCNANTGSVCLHCKFTVLEGSYDKRCVWQLIGLQGINGTVWQENGYYLLKNIINSAYGFSQDDLSPQAINARNCDFSHFDGLEFTARIGVEKEKNGKEKNVIEHAMTAEEGDDENDLPAWALKAKGEGHGE